MSWISHTLHQVGEALPLAVHQAILRREFIVINYHMVSEQKLPHVAHLFPYKTPEMFERDMDYLQQNFNLISYDQLVDHFSGEKRLPSRSVALTFDDGFAECFEVARPLLLKHGIPCSFFVSTNTIDNKDMAKEQKASLCIEQILAMDEETIAQVNQSLQQTFGHMLAGTQALIVFIKSTGLHDSSLIEHLGSLLKLNFSDYLREFAPYLTAAQIQTMDEEGFTIGSHGKEHIQFSSLTEVQIESAIAESCYEIRNLTGRTSIPFAFPHNADGVSRDLLRKILYSNKHIGLLFDSNGIHQEQNFLISRLNGDRSQQGDEKKSQLSINIKKAYIEEIAKRYHRSIGNLKTYE